MEEDKLTELIYAVYELPYFSLIDPQLAISYLITSFSLHVIGLHVSSVSDKLALIKDQDTIGSQGEAINRQRRTIDIHEIVFICIKDWNYQQCWEYEPFASSDVTLIFCTSVLLPAAKQDQSICPKWPLKNNNVPPSLLLFLNAVFILMSFLLSWISALNTDICCKSLYLSLSTEVCGRACEFVLLRVQTVTSSINLRYIGGLIIKNSFQHLKIQ